MNHARRSRTKRTSYRHDEEFSAPALSNLVAEYSEHRQPLAIRWFTWINFPVLFAKLWGALAIFWANNLYSMGFGRMAARDWLPAPVYDAYSMTARTAQMLNWQTLLMWAFVANGLLYLLYILISGEWRYLLPHRRSLREAGQVLLYSFYLSKAHPPMRKFNGLQQIIYTAIILICTGLLATHLAMYYPYELPWVNRMLGGYERARVQDFWLTAGYTLFFTIHIVQLIKSGRNNIKAIVVRPEPKHTPFTE